MLRYSVLTAIALLVTDANTQTCAVQPIPNSHHRYHILTQDTLLSHAESACDIAGLEFASVGDLSGAQELARALAECGGVSMYIRSYLNLGSPPDTCTVLTLDGAPSGWSAFSSVSIWSGAACAKERHVLCREPHFEYHEKWVFADTTLTVVSTAVSTVGSTVSTTSIATTTTTTTALATSTTSTLTTTSTLFVFTTTLPVGTTTASTLTTTVSTTTTAVTAQTDTAVQTVAVGPITLTLTEYLPTVRIETIASDFTATTTTTVSYTCLTTVTTTATSTTTTTTAPLTISVTSILSTTSTSTVSEFSTVIESSVVVSVSTEFDSSVTVQEDTIVVTDTVTTVALTTVTFATTNTSTTTSLSLTTTTTDTTSTTTSSSTDISFTSTLTTLTQLNILVSTLSSDSTTTITVSLFKTTTTISQTTKTATKLTTATRTYSTTTIYSCPTTLLKACPCSPAPSGLVLVKSEVSYTEAECACKRINGVLVDLYDYNKNTAALLLTECSGSCKVTAGWIRSWQGQQTAQCLAVRSDGLVVLESCATARLPAVCRIDPHIEIDDNCFGCQFQWDKTCAKCPKQYLLRNQFASCENPPKYHCDSSARDSFSPWSSSWLKSGAVKGSTVYPHMADSIFAVTPGNGTTSVCQQFGADWLSVTKSNMAQALAVLDHCGHSASGGWVSAFMGVEAERAYLVGTSADGGVNFALEDLDLDMTRPVLCRWREPQTDWQYHRETQDRPDKNVLLAQDQNQLVTDTSTSTTIILTTTLDTLTVITSTVTTIITIPTTTFTPTSVVTSIQSTATTPQPTATTATVASVVTVTVGTVTSTITTLSLMVSTERLTIPTTTGTVLTTSYASTQTETNTQTVIFCASTVD